MGTDLKASTHQSVGISIQGPDTNQYLIKLNEMLKRNADEARCLILEAEQTVEDINKLIRELYEEPRKKINERINELNRVNMRHPYDGAGKMMVEMTIVNRSKKPTWPDAMLYTLVFRDYNRTSRGTVKYFRRANERNVGDLFKWHCIYQRRSKKQIEKLQKSASELSPINLTTQHWQESLIKSRAKDFEYELFKAMDAYLSFDTRRYFLLVERYKRLRQERTEAIRTFCITQQLPIHKIGNAGVESLIEGIETNMPDVEIDFYYQYF